MGSVGQGSTSTRPRRRPRYSGLPAEVSAVSERECLRNRRASQSFEFEIAGLRYTATVSLYPDGRVGEIFLQNHKPGSQSDSNARDAAVAASLALQFGCPLDVLRRALLRDSQGNPSTPLGAALDIISNMARGETE